MHSSPLQHQQQTLEIERETEQNSELTNNCNPSSLEGLAKFIDGLDLVLPVVVSVCFHDDQLCLSLGKGDLGVLAGLEFRSLVPVPRDGHRFATVDLDAVLDLDALVDGLEGGLWGAEGREGELFIGVIRESIHPSINSFTN